MQTDFIYYIQDSFVSGMSFWMVNYLNNENLRCPRLFSEIMINTLHAKITGTVKFYIGLNMSNLHCIHKDEKFTMT